MNRTAVINVVGLTRSLIGEHTPRLQALAAAGTQATIRPAFPAVTCSAQANYLTGKPPRDHGIVGNGWYNRDLAEVHFWKQSNHLVQAAKIWDQLREQDPSFTCAQLFWWFNLYADVDYSITPRPMYPADGRKVFDIYTWPYSLRPEIKRDLGEFPFPTFGGPAAGRNTPQGPPEAVSLWIAEAARWMERRFQPTLNLIYLPHLDYNLQRLGPDHDEIPGDLHRIDQIAGELAEFFGANGVSVLLLSEYGITAVDQPIHLNRRFREQGWLTVKDELGREILDYGASPAFAVADHQIAHIYLNHPDMEAPVRSLLESIDGIDRVLGEEEKRADALDHRRAGHLIAVAQPHAWFSYYYWLDDAKAPDFARCVDIHRKPGFDPVELFLDPKLRWPQAQVAWRLLKKRLGFRMLMDVIPLDASLVRGSHGRISEDPREWPLIITQTPRADLPESIASTQVASLIARSCTVQL